MNSRFFSLALLALVVLPVLSAATPRDPRHPVPVHQAPPNTDDKSLLTPPEGENQRIYGTRYSSLIAPESARALSDKFRAVYGQAASPRIAIYVNRALMEGSSLRVSAHTEKNQESTTSSKNGESDTATTATVETTYTAPNDDDATTPTLADQQTVREIERLFGRVFRNAGAQLADQRTAAAMAGGQPGVRLGGRGAVKEREALAQVADVVIEVLISSRDLTVTRVSGDVTYNVPDIQATAIRLSDAAILGQAAASDVLGGGTEAEKIARQFGVSDITEATAFALMEDMLTGK